MTTTNTTNPITHPTQEVTVSINPDVIARMQAEHAARQHAVAQCVTAALALTNTTPKEITVPMPKFERLIARPTPFATPTTVAQAVLDEHDFDAYDSSDIHLRTQEWESQAREVAFIEFHIPAKLPITDAQRLRANAVMDKVSPGVTFGPGMSQRNTYTILASYIGADEASRLLANA